MITDNTKIPFGWGGVRIEFNNDYLYFKLTDDKDQWFEEEEITDEFRNLDVTEIKEIYGYHFTFDLYLRDRDIENQDNIMKFWYYYNVNKNSDKSFKIYPMYNTGLMNKRWKKRIEFEVLLKKRELFNLSDSKTGGTGLHIQIKTKKKITVAQYNAVIYRERAGDWGVIGVNETVLGRFYNILRGGIDGLS